MARFDIKVFFATNRDQVRGKPEFGPDFASHPVLFRVGSARVTLDLEVSDDGVENSDPKIEAIEVFDEVRASDGSGFRKVGTERLFPELAAQMAEQRCDALCFIPGFNYSFQDSIERAALLAALYSPSHEKPLVAVVFSWPSDGRMSLGNYLSDRTDAELSGPAIARSAARLSELYIKHMRGQRGAGQTGDCGQRLHLLAHSMGAHALKHAVAALRRLPGARQLRVFETAIIAAGDTERDALEAEDKMGNLSRLAKSVHVYINEKDKPLELSDELVDPPDRLGSYGPDGPDHRRAFRCATFDRRLPQGRLRRPGRHAAPVLPGQPPGDPRHQGRHRGPRPEDFTHRWFDEKRNVYRVDAQ